MTASDPSPSDPEQHQSSPTAAETGAASSALDPNSSGGKEPIGQILKRAGLLSDSQIQLALMDQNQHNLLFGEILVMRGWLKPQTLNFFLDSFRRAYQASQMTIPQPEEIPSAPRPSVPDPTKHTPHSDHSDTVPSSQVSPSSQPQPDPPPAAPVPTLSAEIPNFGEEIDFSELEQAITDYDDLSRYLTQSKAERPRTSQPANHRPTNRAKTNGRKVDGFALEADLDDEESADLSFEQGLSEAELRALLELD